MGTPHDGSAKDRVRQVLQDINGGSRATIQGLCRKYQISTPTFYKYRNEVRGPESNETLLRTTIQGLENQNMDLRRENQRLKDFVVQSVLSR